MNLDTGFLRSSRDRARGTFDRRAGKRNLTPQIAVRFEPATFKRIAEMAQTRGLPFAHMVRILVNEALK